MVTTKELFVTQQITQRALITHTSPDLIPSSSASSSAIRLRSSISFAIASSSRTCNSAANTASVPPAFKTSETKLGASSALPPSRHRSKDSRCSSASLIFPSWNMSTPRSRASYPSPPSSSNSRSVARIAIGRSPKALPVGWMMPTKPAACKQKNKTRRQYNCPYVR